MRNGIRPSIVSSALEKFTNALLRQEAFSVHPVAMSTTVRVRQNSPGARTAVGDGVGLDVAGQAVQFVAGLPDRDGVAQQLARGPGRHGSPGPGGVPRLFEVPVHRGRAHPLQLQEREPVIVGELAMRAQHRQPRRQHRLQILRARQIHHQPHPHQQVARLL